MEDVLETAGEITVRLNEGKKMLEWKSHRSFIDHFMGLFTSILAEKSNYRFADSEVSIFIHNISHNSFSFEMKVGNEVNLDLLENVNQDVNGIFELLSNIANNDILNAFEHKYAGPEVYIKLIEFYKDLSAILPATISSSSGKKYHNGPYFIENIDNQFKQRFYKKIKETLDNRSPDVVGQTIPLDFVDITEVKPQVWNDVKEKGEFYVYMAPSITSIQINGRNYFFNSPLLLEAGKEEGYAFLKSDILDIYANGEDLDSALLDFYEDFDYLYNRLMELSDDQLGEKMLRAKNYLKLTVKKIENVRTESKKG